MDTPARTLATVALVLAVTLAGCSVLGSGETPTRVTVADGGGADGATATEPPSASEEPSPSATATATATPTAEPTPTPDPETGVVVVDVAAEGTGNDEYVVIGNAGDVPLDLSGWRVSDLDGHVHEFADGVVLDSGERLRLYSGQGTQTGQNRYWWADGEVWDDRGETVSIHDETGQKVFDYSYG